MRTQKELEQKLEQLQLERRSSIDKLNKTMLGTLENNALKEDLMTIEVEVRTLNFVLRK